MSQRIVACVCLGVALGFGAPIPASCQESGGPDSHRAPSGRAESSAAPPSTSPASLRASDRDAIVRRWGIEVQGLQLTAAGYMLDFRYKVVDPAKAAPLFERRVRPILKDEKTGAIMAVPVPPKTGALRSSNDPKEGRTYFMFFANPGRFIDRFSRVTVSIGEFSITGLTVK